MPQCTWYHLQDAPGYENHRFHKSLEAVEIGGLLKAWNLLSSLGFPKGNVGIRYRRFNEFLQSITDKLEMDSQ